MGEAIPFIQWRNDQFVVEKAAAAALATIRGKIAIVVVAGPYRTGKSYLLNRLIGQQHGFNVGGTVKACTKGIWLWGAPLRVGDTTYVFMDSEGLGSIEQEQTFDAQIFSLSILLSSLFILNTQGTISESALEQMELVVECTKKIRVRDSTSESKSDSTASELNDLAEHFPAFLWVLRDFALSLADDNGNPITSKQYLEAALKPQVGARAASKNRIRHAITTVFPKRDCVTLVRPLTDESQLQKLNTLPWTQLRPEFRTQVEALRSQVLERAKAKQISGNYLNGPSFVSLAMAYVDVMNNGAVPTIQSAWESVVAQTSRDALDSGLATFAREVKIGIPDERTVMEHDAIITLLRHAEAAAVRAVRDRAVGDESHTQSLVDTLQSKISITGQEAMRNNELRSSEKSRRVIDEMWDAQGMEGKLSSCTSSSDVSSLRESFYQQFLARQTGPAKDEIARVFLEKKLSIVLSRAFDRLKTLNADLERTSATLHTTQTTLANERDAATKERASLTLARDKEALRVQAGEEEVKRLRHIIDDEKRRYDAIVHERDRLTKEITKITMERDRESMRVAQQTDELSQARTRIDDEQKRVVAAQQEISAITKQLNAVTADKEKVITDRESVRERLAGIERDRLAETKELRDQQSNVNASLATLKQKLQESEASAATERANYQNQLKQAEEEAREWQTQVTKQEKKIKKLMESEAAGSSSTRELRDQLTKAENSAAEDAAKAKRDINEAKAAIAKLEKVKSDLEVSLKKAMDNEASILAARDNDTKAATGRDKERTKELTRIRDDMAAAEAKARDDAAAERVKLEEKLTAALEDVTRLKEKRAADKKARQDEEKARTRAADDVRIAGEKEAKLRDKELAETNKNLREARTRIDELTSTNRSLQTSVESKAGSSATAIKDADARASAAEKKVAAERAEVEKIKAKLSAMEAELKEAKEEADSGASETQKLAAELKKVKEEHKLAIAAAAATAASAAAASSSSSSSSSDRLSMMTPAKDVTKRRTLLPEPAQPEAFLSSASRLSMSSGRPSLAPSSSSSSSSSRQSLAPVAGPPAVDPNVEAKGFEGLNPHDVTVQQLKSWLTALNVELSPNLKVKQQFLDLLLDTSSMLRNKWGSGPTKKRKA